MGRHKMIDGKLVSIGAKVTEEQMKEIKDLVQKLGMKSRSELCRAALANYLRNPPVKKGYSASVTNDAERNFGVRLNTCTAYKELEISLNDAITRLKLLDECSRSDSLVPCSNVKCPKMKRPENN